MDATIVRSELERSDFFRGLDAAALNAMIQSASVQRLRPGQVLLRQGEEPRALYMVASGCFKLSHVKPDGKQLTVRYMGTGDERLLHWFPSRPQAVTALRQAVRLPRPTGPRLDLGQEGHGHQDR